MRFFCWLLQLKVTGKRNVLQVSFAFRWVLYMRIYPVCYFCNGLRLYSIN
uniref:Uncharacterized protein n=2 Tax=Enterobacteriaceae TaxID=543 RepID=A7KGC4_KLEPN|nr:hypothetical protein [Klebsiella pneumoniae]AVE24017.1 hypothetical protein [Enterobacter cloacae]UUW41583.1 hypothetical protein [Leclercia sp. 29361]